MDRLANEAGVLRLAQQRWRRTVRWAKYSIGHDPALLPLYLRLTPLGLSRQITPTTELVVEGFPRSGNTFTVFALQDVTLGQLRVVSHVHVPAQVKLSVAKGVPVVLLVREPLATLASYLAYDPRSSATDALKEYIGYHRQLVPYAHDVLVCDFQDLTTNFNALIDNVNLRFGFGLGAFDQSPENVQKLFDAIDRHHRLIHPKVPPDTGAARPSKSRLSLTDKARRELLSATNAERLDRARQLYAYFSSLARAPVEGSSAGRSSDAFGHVLRFRPKPDSPDAASESG